MIKEENILTSRFGKENHFQVPEGYFEQLTGKVMAQLPERETMESQQSHRTVLWQRLPLRKWAAAVAAVVVFGAGIGVAFKNMSSHTGVIAHVEQHLHQQNVNSDETDFDEMADYTMMDNEAIYASLIAEN